MKFSSLILGTVASSFAIISCSKDKGIDPPPVAPSINPVAVIKFDGDATDSLGKVLIDGSYGVATFVDDHKGNPNGAMYFDGTDKLSYYNLALKGQATSMVAWVKLTQVSQGSQHFISAMHATKGGITLYQADMVLGSSVSVPGTTSAASENNNSIGWHHFASTFDGKDIRIYIDGQLVDTQSNPGSIGDEKRGLLVGGYSNYFWKGAIDDLRIYDAVLTSEAISKMAAQ
jgi:hypothetical protein